MRRIETMLAATSRNGRDWRSPEANAEVDALARLRAQRELCRRYLPFLKTLADLDIACQVGLHELSGAPLTVKQLMLLDIAPAVTVFRRLERLCTCGAVLRTQSSRDRRVHELRLAPDVHHRFAMYLRSDGSQMSDSFRPAGPRVPAAVSLHVPA